MENERSREQAQQQSAVPQIPPLRRYIIERYNPNTDALESTPMQAHLAQHVTSDAVQFVEFIYDPTVQMIRERIVLCVSAFESYWEDYTPPSNLVLPSNGNRH